VSEVPLQIPAVTLQRDGSSESLLPPSIVVMVNNDNNGQVIKSLPPRDKDS